MSSANLASADTAPVGDAADEGRDGRHVPPAPVAFWRTNRGIAVILLILVAAIGANIWFSDWAHQASRDGFTLGGFPLFAVGMMTLSLLIMLFDGKARKATPEFARVRLRDLLVVLVTIALSVVAFLAIGWIGFMPAIALFVFVGATALGFRPLWISLLVALGTSIGLRVLLFALGMNVTDGPLGALLGGH
ncbi:hypothetical protein AB7M35_001992 [Amorphus suaedae]